jgi:uncharacterized membrane protein
MKRVYLLLIACLLAAGCIWIVSADNTPTVTITGYQVNPPVLMPDSLGTITVTIKNTASSATVKENTGQTSADSFQTTKTTDINVNIERVSLEGKGITVVSKDFEQVGAIGPGQAIPITFSVRAPLASGMYYPEVWVDTTGGKSTRYPIPVNVNTAIGIQKQAILIMDTQIAGTANPGEEIPVTVSIRNAGGTLADDVVVKIENVGSTVAPKNADLYHLGSIGPGEQRSADLILLSDKRAGSGLVRIPVTITYNAIDGPLRSQTTGIDVMMKGKAELGFVSVDTSPKRVGEMQEFDLTIRIENTGTGEAKQVAATVDLPMTGTKQAFIGKIKPGNDAPAVFMLDGGHGGSYGYNVSIIYADDLGTHTITRSMELRVTPEDRSGTIIMLVIIALLGLAAYKFWYLPRKNGNGKFPWETKN